jgi:hypothetical protein
MTLDVYEVVRIVAVENCAFKWSGPETLQRRHRCKEDHVLIALHVINASVDRRVATRKQDGIKH